MTYRILAFIDPLVRVVWKAVGLGNVVELEVSARGGTGTRRRLVGLLRGEPGEPGEPGAEHFLGHPNGDVGWTRDLRAAGCGTIRWPQGGDWRFRAVELGVGDERERAIRATSQHPFPGNLVYRVGRPQIRAVGVFFRLEDAA